MKHNYLLIISKLVLFKKVVRKSRKWKKDILKISTNGGLVELNESTFATNDLSEYLLLSGNILFDEKLASF